MSDKPAGPFSAWERSLALRYLRARRKNGGAALISVIAFISVALAVGVLIIVMSVMNGFRTDLLSRIVGFNGHIYVQGEAINGPGREPMLSRLRAIPGVVQAAPVIESPAMVVGASQTNGAIVRAMRPADVFATPIIANRMVEGQVRGFGDGEYGGDNILAGARLAATMGVHAGDELTLISASGSATALGSAPRRKPYVVNGVFSVGMSEYDSAFVYMPLEQAQLFFGRGDNVDMIEVNLTDADQVDAMKPLVVKAAGPGAIVTDWRDRNKSFFNALQVERSVMRLILLLIVGIAAINILSGIIMLVRNKTRDIAVLRTMGASQGAVMRIFLMAGATLGAAGAATGLVLGTLFCVFIDPIQTLVERVTGVSVFSPDTYFLSRIPARVEPGEVALTVVATLIMSLLATLWPAWRASRLDPVEALRYE